MKDIVSIEVAGWTSSWGVCRPNEGVCCKSQTAQDERAIRAQTEGVLDFHETWQDERG